MRVKQPAVGKRKGRAWRHTGIWRVSWCISGGHQSLQGGLGRGQALPPPVIAKWAKHPGFLFSCSVPPPDSTPGESGLAVTDTDSKTTIDCRKCSSSPPCPPQDPHAILPLHLWRDFFSVLSFIIHLGITRIPRLKSLSTKLVLYKVQ